MNFLGNYRNPKDNCPYQKHKNYVGASAFYPEHITQTKSLPREKATIIKWTRLGYSINQIAQGLEKVHNGHARSTSYIHKTVRNAIMLGTLRKIDKRKLPSKIRLYCSSKRRKMFMLYLPQWLAFLKGEVDKPP